MDFSSQKIMQWSRMGMRKAYGAILNELAYEHDNLVSIAADVVDSANLMDFEMQHPDRHFNAGISEQNMVAMAAGMAKEGSNVFVTSFAPFVSLRVYEAIRTLVCYMNLNVKIVALSSGFSLGVQGATHYALEDIAIMRAIPNLLMLSPADTTEMAKMLEYLASYKGPAYLRLTGLPGSATVYKEDYEYDHVGFDVIREGNDIGIFATGTLVNESIRAARVLSKNGTSVGVTNISKLNPINRQKIISECMKYRMLFSVEEHSVVGGLGSIISETIAAVSHHPQLIRMGILDNNVIVGNYTFILEKNNLNAKQIVERVGQEIKRYNEEYNRYEFNWNNSTSL